MVKLTDIDGQAYDRTPGLGAATDQPGPFEDSFAGSGEVNGRSADVTDNGQTWTATPYIPASLIKDNTTQITNQTGNSTTQHTVDSTSDRVIVAIAGEGQNAPPVITSITIDGNAMTSASGVVSEGTNPNQWGSIYYYDGGDVSGAVDVVVTFQNTSNVRNYRGVIVSFINAKTGTPIWNSDSGASVTSTSFSLSSVDSESESVDIVSHASDSTSFTPGTNQTEIFDGDAGSGPSGCRVAASYNDVDSGTVTLTQTNTGTAHRMVHVGIAVEPAAGLSATGIDIQSNAARLNTSGDYARMNSLSEPNVTLTYNPGASDNPIILQFAHDDSNNADNGYIIEWDADDLVLRKNNSGTPTTINNDANSGFTVSQNNELQVTRSDADEISIWVNGNEVSFSPVDDSAAPPTVGQYNGFRAGTLIDDGARVDNLDVSVDLNDVPAAVDVNAVVADSVLIGEQGMIFVGQETNIDCTIADSVLVGETSSAIGYDIARSEKRVGTSRVLGKDNYTPLLPSKRKRLGFKDKDIEQALDKWVGKF